MLNQPALLEPAKLSQDLQQPFDAFMQPEDPLAGSFLIQNPQHETD